MLDRHTCTFSVRGRYTGQFTAAYLSPSATQQPGIQVAHIRWHQPPSAVTFMAPPTQGQSVQAGGWLRPGRRHTSHSQLLPSGWLDTP